MFLSLDCTLFFYQIYYVQLSTLQLVCVYVCMCMYVRVCVCMCVCVFLCGCVYTLPSAGFFRLQDVFESWEYLLRVFLGISAKFLHLYFWIYHISPPKTKNSSRPLTGEETIWYNVWPRKDEIYWYYRI